MTARAPDTGGSAPTMIAFLLRSCATLMVMAGVSAVAAGLASLPILSEESSARPIVTIVYQMAAVSLLGGSAALYVLRTRRALFLNEGAATLSPGAQTALGGWLIVMAIALAGVPVWMLLSVRDFLAEWRGIIEVGATSTMWRDSASSAAGLVLLPIFAAITPPFLELLAVIGFVAASVTSLTLLASRKRTFPRLYTAWLLLLVALVVLSLRGAAGSTLAAQVVERALDRSSRDAAEAAPIFEFVRRYLSVVTTTATVLVWTLCGYLLWLPFLLFSSRVRSTFQR